MNSLALIFVAFLPLSQTPLPHIGSLTDPLRSPARVAIAADGTVFVTETLHNRVVRYDTLGATLGMWPVPEGPVGVAVHPDGRIFISLRDTPGIVIYDAAFNRLPGMVGDGIPFVTFVKPTDIDIDAATGRIYVTDGAGDRLYGFNADGSLALIVGTRGAANGEFRYPSAVAFDAANNRLVVADHDNHRLQVFSAAGVFQFRFGYRNKYVGVTQEGWTPRTQGVAVDPAGRIYVSDALMGTVRVFDATGIELNKAVVYGTGAGELRTPCDLALNATGTRLYVVNTNNASVEIYDTAGARAGGDLLPDLADLGELTTRRPWTLAEPTNGLGLSKGARRGVAVWRIARDPAPSDDAGRVTADLPEGGYDIGAPSSGPRSPGSPRTTYQLPHVIDEPRPCDRCHGIVGQPGGQPQLLAGQINTCFSCHSAGGQALDKPMHERDLADPYATNPDAADGRGRSHAWAVAAVNVDADSVGPTAGGAMERYLDPSGNIKCTTCHEPHNSDAGAPLLRMSNLGDAMCKQCHAPRNKGRFVDDPANNRGTHPVGFAYPAATGEFPDAAALAPLQPVSGKVECMSCHGVHNADSGGANGGEGDGMLLRTANDETLCKTCHTNHIGHTPAGAWQPTCEDCHGIHDPANNNLSLVSATVRNQTLGADKPVVFTATTGPNSFDDGDPTTNDGICQVCHTVTTYHKHDGSGITHNDAADCTTCHPHEDGFMPTGGDCTACHASAQDNGDGIPISGRRAVVGEFPVGDAHAHYGSELDSSACTVCHDQTTHMDGNVDLIDADTGALYTFVRPEDMLSDPDVSDFCASCHDADGATRLASPLDPFGNGGLPTAVAAKFQGTLQWTEQYGDFCFGTEGTLRGVNSHHDISDADQAFSGARIECLHCHGAHTSAASQPVADPFATTTPWTGSTNAFCLSCHGGGGGPLDPGFPAGVVGPEVDTLDPQWSALGVDWCRTLDGACETASCSSLRGIDVNEFVEGPWWVEYANTYATHGPNSKRPWPGYSGAPSYDLDCTACHDPHGSNTPTHPAGNPYMIRDIVDGTPFIDDGARPLGFNGPPFVTTGTLRTVEVAASGSIVTWGNLCVACHADWLAAYSWHSLCDGCQTCHGHGMAWNEHDWGTPPQNDTLIPRNDACYRAFSLPIGTSVTFDNTDAVDDNAPTCGTASPTRGVWYEVAGTGTTLTASTCLPGTTFNTVISVFCDCDTMDCVAGNDDANCVDVPGASSVSWCSDPDQLYYIQVGGATPADSGAFALIVTEDGLPCGPAVVCVPEIGACCVGGALVENNERSHCDALGGTWYVGENCSSFSCPAPRATAPGAAPRVPDMSEKQMPSDDGGLRPAHRISEPRSGPRQ